MSAPFEERSGVVPCGTPWGQWYQTLEEVFIEVRVPPGTRAQDIQCGLQSRHVALAVGGREILKVASGRSGLVLSLSPASLASRVLSFLVCAEGSLGDRSAFLAGRKSYGIGLVWVCSEPVLSGKLRPVFWLDF